MAKVRSLGYIRLVSDKVTEWVEFATQILGMMPVGDPDDARAHFRIDKYAHRLSVSRGANASVEALGYEVGNPADLAEVVDELKARGIDVVDGTDLEAAERAVTGFVRFTDPGGVPVELFYGPKYDYSPVVTPLVSGFVSGPDVGMGHTALACPNAAHSYELYTHVLGFADRNTMRRGDRRTWFMSPNPRQHTLAVSDSDSFRLSHFMLEMRSIDDVGRALDRVTELGTPLLLSFGRHTNDEMMSFYVVTPDGFSVEVGCAGLMVTDDRPTFEIPSPTLWGHHRGGRSGTVTSN